MEDEQQGAGGGGGGDGDGDGEANGRTLIIISRLSPFVASGLL